MKIDSKMVKRGWIKAFGPQPNDEAFTVATALVAQSGIGKHALALAMYLRPVDGDFTGGATDGEVRAAVKKLFQVAGVQQPLHNYRRENIAAGYLKRDAGTPKRDDDTVYRVELTAKGAAVVKRNLDAAKAKAVTVEAPVKPAKAKRKAVKPAPQPISEPQPAPVSEPVSEPQPISEQVTA